MVPSEQTGKRSAIPNLETSINHTKNAIEIHIRQTHTHRTDIHLYRKIENHTYPQTLFEAKQIRKNKSPFREIIPPFHFGKRAFR